VKSAAADIDQLRDEIEVQERELRAAFVELGEVTRESMEPQHWIRSRPLTWFFGALALGAWLGGRARRHND
jgi:hypothetical protein